MPREGFRAVVDPAIAAAHREAGWWGDRTVVDLLREHARARPEGPAYITAAHRVTWRELDEASDRLAGALVARGVEAGDRVAVLLPDGPTVHAVYLGAEKAGATVVGIGVRAGRREVRHLLDRTGATLLVAHADGPVVPTIDRLVVPRIETAAVDDDPIDADVCEARRIGPDDLFLLNSTSGTTGLPKCVMHTQNRWFYFHRRAVAHGALGAGDVFVSAVPAPFGFGIWTAHVTPIILGAPTVLLERFAPDDVLALIERERVTVLCCVSSQFVMLLSSADVRRRDLSSLRVMFTGGEMVPYERALEFERATGATVLQFYGSNETGLLSGTRLDDPPARRLRTAGRVVPEMQVRLFDAGVDVTARGRGQPGCRGPATSVGYLDDPEGNRQLFTPEGWLLVGDVCTIDGDGYLTVVGRTADVIIRGGKNISAGEVEAEVSTHPAVAMAAAVPIEDPVLGERVCACVQLRLGVPPLTLSELVDHLVARGVGKELLPEHLVVVDRLPTSSGGKIAKGELREIARTRLVLADVNHDTGGKWRLDHRLAGGMLGGACQVSDGSDVAVLKWHDPSSDVPRNPDAPAVVEHVRTAGYPTPAWLAWGSTPGGMGWSIQELVDGEPNLHLDIAAAERVLSLVRLQRTICPPTAMSWTGFMCETVAGAPPDLRAFAEPYEPSSVPDDEMVHGDLSLSNVLVRDGRIAGVIDIDATGRGCAVYDLLAVVVNGLAWDADPDGLALLREYALATYDVATVRLAATCLVVEALHRASTRDADRVDALGETYRQWLRSL